MLMDILAVIIAFSTVILLFSVIITSLNQATQATFRLRGRNLRYGIAAALRSKIRATTPESKIAATKILSAADDAALRTPKNSLSLVSRLLGPRVTWLEPEELGTILDDGIEMPNRDDTDAIVSSFKKLDKPLRNRFENIMRGVTIFWAIVVAAVFQISTPDLIKRLSTDPELRARYVAAAPAAMTLAETHFNTTPALDDVSENAVRKMRSEHPGLGRELDRLDTGLVHQEELAEEFAEMIESRDDRDDLVAEFEEYVIEVLVEQREESFKHAGNAADQLSVIDITPMRQGLAFYTDPRVMLTNILGVLMTAILLMLGAPFWYNTLKQAVAWRDLFARR